MKQAVRILGAVILLAAAAGGGGCASTAINTDSHNTFLTADDLVAMTDKMAAAITSDPHVAAVTANGPMVIVMRPIINDTNEIIRGNRKELYVHRVRVLMSEKQVLRSRFTFVLDRQTYLKLQAEEGLPPSALGPEEHRLQPEWVLTGRFYADTNAGSRQRSDYYLCTYQLTRLTGPDAGRVLWEGTYETKKSAVKGMLD